MTDWQMTSDWHVKYLQFCIHSQYIWYILSSFSAWPTSPLWPPLFWQMWGTCEGGTSAFYNSRSLQYKIFLSVELSSAMNFNEALSYASQKLSVLDCILERETTGLHERCLWWKRLVMLHLFYHVIFIKTDLSVIIFFDITHFLNYKNGNSSLNFDSTLCIYYIY